MNRIFGIYSSSKSIKISKDFFKLVQREGLHINNEFTENGLYLCEIAKKRQDSNKNLNSINIDGSIINLEELKKEYGQSFCKQKDFLNYIYQKKPSEWPSYLIGNFSISFYDPDKNKLTILRDHFGSKPLYYFHSKEIFIFASEIKYILSATNLKMTANSKKIAQYLCQYKENHHETFYNEIHSVPPSHYVEISREGLNLKKYKFYRDLSFKGQELKQAALELREILRKSIKNRVIQNSRTGILVSGGLDSSAIYVLSKTISTHNTILPMTMNFYDATGSLLECDESDFQEEVLKEDRRIKIEFKEQSPFDITEFYLDTFDQPTNLANIYLWEETYRKASQFGIDGVIDGFDGDNIFSHGWYRFRELFKLSTIFSFVKELYLFNKIHSYGTYTSVPMWKKILIPLLKNSYIFRPIFQLKNVFKQRKNITRIVNKDLLRKIPFKEQYNEMKMFKQHEEFLSNPNIDLAFTNLNILAFKYGINQQSPLFDLNVTEFCKSLPSEMKLSNGISRNIIREALREEMPIKVLNRFEKANLTENFIKKISKKDLKNIEREVLDIHPLIKNIIDEKSLKNEFELFKKFTKNEKILMNIWCFYQVNRWLKRSF